MRQYKTSTGTYVETELAVVVWMNPKHKDSSQSRFLETMTSENSKYPMAFPIRFLTKHYSWRNAKIAATTTDVVALIPTTDRSHPLLIPLNVAKSAFGWEDFYIPSEYIEEF